MTNKTLSVNEFVSLGEALQNEISKLEKEKWKKIAEIEKLANTVVLSEEENAREEQTAEMEDALNDIAYVVGAEWSGSFTEGEVTLWEASSC